MNKYTSELKIRSVRSSVILQVKPRNYSFRYHYIKLRIALTFFPKTPSLLTIRMVKIPLSAQLYMSIIRWVEKLTSLNVHCNINLHSCHWVTLQECRYKCQNITKRVHVVEDHKPLTFDAGPWNLMLFEDLLRFCTVRVIWCTTSDSASKNSTTGGTILTPATVPSITDPLTQFLQSISND